MNYNATDEYILSFSKEERLMTIKKAVKRLRYYHETRQYGRYWADATALRQIWRLRHG